MFIPTEEIRVRASFDLSVNDNFKTNKHLIAANGERLVSRQELEIYDYLLQFEELHVAYEKAFEGMDKTLYPDFTVTNKVTRKSYVWEHLGMTNNENYLDKIPNKIEWYRKNGLETIESGGALIISFYRRESFYRDVVNFVKMILQP